MDLRARVITLNETRARVWEEGKRLLDDTAGREMSAEERQTWDRINERLNDIDAEVKTLVDREEREREAAQVREINARIFGEAPKAAVADPNAELRAFLASGRGSYEVDIQPVIRERQLLRQGGGVAEFRALYGDTGNSGSLVPTTLARTLYEYMEASIAMFRAPTTKLTTASGERLEIPRLTAHTIGTQVVAQGTAIGGTDPGFAKLALDAYKYGSLVSVANELLQDAAIDLAGFLGRDMGRALGRIIDADLVVGTGTNEPNGIMTAGSARVKTGGTLLTPSYDVLVNAVYSVADEYRQGGSAGWLMADSSAGTIRKLRDGAGGTIGAVLWEPSLTNGLVNGTPDRLLGYPVFTDPNVAAAGSNARTLAFGDMSAYYVRQVGNPVIESDPSFGFDKDLTTFRAKWRVDGDLIDVDAVTVVLQNA
jgi:HK97 family phage major capsid protein